MLGCRQQTVSFHQRRHRVCAKLHTFLNYQLPMAKLDHWQIYLLRHEPEYLGVVAAADRDAAIEVAIKKFKIPDQDRQKLFAQRTD
jgi:hypothetical protein